MMVSVSWLTCFLQTSPYLCCMNPSTDLLLVFVKHPVPGKVKTRLAATIGHDAALAIYRELLAHTCSLAHAFSGKVAIWYGNEIPESDLWSEAGFDRYPQSGADLGERMAQAFEWGWQQGYQRIALIGSDCATLTGEILEEAFVQLQKQDTVLGPAEDGGYYLIGMRQWTPAVFQHKTWSTETVFEDTMADLQTANRSVSLLPTLSDVDTEADLQGTFLEGFLASLS
jgi:rSAM/selenodomain-associated transferase 1